MELQEQRMQFLKMAFELGGKPEQILSAARQLMDFVMGEPEPEVGATADPVPEPASEPVAAVEVAPDPIAACGTALVMPEGGELADAMPTAETTASALEAEPQVTEVAEAATAEAATDADAGEAAPSDEPEAIAGEEQAAPAAAADDAPEVEAVSEAPIAEEVPDAPAAPAEMNGSGGETATPAS